MTRKQAQVAADQLVALARETAQRDGVGETWTQLELAVPAGLRAKVDEAPWLVTGVLPMGWRLGGQLGSPTIIIRRAL